MKRIISLVLLLFCASVAWSKPALTDEDMKLIHDATWAQLRGSSQIILQFYNGSTLLGSKVAGTLALKCDGVSVGCTYSGSTLTIGAGSGGTFPTLNQVLDPTADKTFSMAGHLLGFSSATSASSPTTGIYFFNDTYTFANIGSGNTAPVMAMDVQYSPSAESNDEPYGLFIDFHVPSTATHGNNGDVINGALIAASDNANKGASFPTGLETVASSREPDDIITGLFSKADNSGCSGVLDSDPDLPNCSLVLPVTTAQIIAGDFRTSTTGGLVTEIDGIIIRTPSLGGGTISNSYGLKISDQNAASNNWAIKTGLGSVEFGDNTTLDKSLLLKGSSTGTATISTQAAAGTPTITLGTSSGTPAVTASSPLAITTATGNITCTTCTTNASGLTANQLVIGGGSQAAAALGSLGTTTTVLHGNAGGVPSFAGVSLANDTAANQGTATTVLHGNASGQPSFGAVSLATDVSGQLPIAAVGSAGLSGTAPVAIASTGAISCATCTTNASALTSNVLVKGGGSQATQTSSITDDGTQVSTAEVIRSGNTVVVGPSNFTTSSTSLVTITGLSWTLPASAHNYAFSCRISYSQATAAATDAFGVQAATTAPTNLYAAMRVSTGLAITGTDATLPTLASTTATNIGTFTPSAAGAIGTVADIFVADIWGYLEQGAGATTLNIMVLSGSGSDALTIYRGSSCTLR